MPANWLCSGVFLLPRDLLALHSLATDHWPLFFRSTPHAPRQRGQVVRGLFPAGCCHPPTPELAKTERGPISTAGPFLFIMSPNRAIASGESNFSSPLTAAQPLTILSWPETLNANGSIPACRMASGWNPRAPCLAP